MLAELGAGRLAARANGAIFGGNASFKLAGRIAWRGLSSALAETDESGVSGPASKQPSCHSLSSAHERAQFEKRKGDFGKRRGGKGSRSLRRSNKGVDYSDLQRAFERDAGISKTPFEFEDGKELHKYRFQEERMDSIDAKKKILHHVLRDDQGALDLRGKAVVGRAIGADGSGTFYEYGGTMTLRTPKPLHHGVPGDKNSSFTTNQLKHAVKKMIEASDPEAPRKPGFDEEIEIALNESELILYKGEILPDFGHPPEVKSGDEDPVKLSWRMIEFSQESRRPIKCRVLKQMSAGFIVAVGAIIGFMPNSHVASNQRGGGGYYRAVNTIGPAMVGEQIWVMILSSERQTNNLVVSHRLVPSHYAFRVDTNNATAHSNFPQTRMNRQPLATLQDPPSKSGPGNTLRKDESKRKD